MDKNKSMGEMISRKEILGRDEKIIKKFKTKGCGFLGKIVTYPGGKYEEVGGMYIDLVSPHCMLVLGKRGTGKSYTLGVLAESFALQEPSYRERISVILIDSMSVFHSLKQPNINRSEVKRLKDFTDQKPQGFDEFVRIFMPKLTVDWFKEKNQPIMYDNLLQFSLNDVEVYDWLSLFNLKPTEPIGVLLSEVIEDLRGHRYFFGFKEIYSEIENRKVDKYVASGLKSMVKMVENMGLFAEIATPYEEIVKGGQISILDISYLGRTGGFDVRNLIVTLIARRLLGERTLYTTLEMQQQANLVDTDLSADISKDYPLVYMLIDEAHLFLPSFKKTLSTDVLVDWIKLGRHPGLSLILATQEPSALHESAIRQSDIIIAHNITSNDDVEALGKAKQTFMKGGHDIQKVVSTMEFKKGLAVVFDDKTRKVQMCRVRPRFSLHTGIDASAIPPEELGILISNRDGSKGGSIIKKSSPKKDQSTVFTSSQKKSKSGLKISTDDETYEL